MKRDTEIKIIMHVETDDPAEADEILTKVPRVPLYNPTPARLDSLDIHCSSLDAPSEEVRDLIRRHYHDAIIRASKDHGITDVRYIVDPDA